MKYIHTLVALFAVVLFSACNEQEDIDRGMDHNFGEGVATGFYTSQYDVNSKYEYGVVVTENAKGEPTVYSYRVGKPGSSDSAVVRTTFVSETFSYDAQTGILEASAKNSYYESEAKAYICKLLDGGRMIYQLSYGEKSDKATMVLSNATPTVEGNWQAANADSSVVYKFFLDMPNAEGAGVATLSQNDGEAVEGTYTTAHGTTTVTVGGAEYTLAFNEKMQLVATNAEGSMVLDRAVSAPEPEQFLAAFGGIYTVNASVISGDFLFGSPQPTETVLYQSDKYPENFAVAPFINSEKPMFFTMNNDGTLTVVNQGTGVNSQYGEVFITDILSLQGIADPASYYDSKKAIFYFAVAYHVPAGIFGYYYDTLQLTEEYTSKKEPMFVKAKENVKNVFQLSENAKLMK